jgi:RNA polymerase sigma factor (sigma-70 family)
MNRDSAGRDAAIGDLVVEHRDALRATIAWRFRNPLHLEEALSDAIFEIMRSWETYDPKRSFKAWACTIARNVAVRKLRKAMSEASMIEDIEVVEIAEEMEDVTNESGPRLEALSVCYEKLRGRHRRLLRARHHQGQSFAEMAAKLGKTENCLQVAVHRLHAILRECVSDQVKHL